MRLRPFIYAFDWMQIALSVILILFLWNRIAVLKRNPAWIYLIKYFLLSFSLKNHSVYNLNFAVVLLYIFYHGFTLYLNFPWIIKFQIFIKNKESETFLKQKLQLLGVFFITHQLQHVKLYISAQLYQKL